MLVALITALSMASAGPAGAAPAATPASPPPAAAAKPDTVCWTEQPVGSHIPHRYCAPRAYWEQRQRMDQEALSIWKHGSAGGGGGGTMSPSGGGGNGP